MVLSDLTLLSLVARSKETRRELVYPYANDSSKNLKGLAAWDLGVSEQQQSTTVVWCYCVAVSSAGCVPLKGAVAVEEFKGESCWAGVGLGHVIGSASCIHVYVLRRHVQFVTEFPPSESKFF